MEFAFEFHCPNRIRASCGSCGERATFLLAITNSQGKLAQHRQPGYFFMIDVAQIEDGCKNASKNVSKDARKLIQVILNAITEDPHPNWQTSPEFNLETARELTKGIPSFLEEIIETQNVHATVTSFDILHWLSQNIDKIASMRKGGTRPTGRPGRR